MEVSQNKISYTRLLLELLESNQNIDLTPYKEEIKINLYLTLLSLSNYQKPDKFNGKIDEIVKSFLRKINNLKVKIQLKRKQEEIDLLSEEIIKNYQENNIIISKYNEKKLDIESIIKSKDTKQITNLIDSLTKTKMKEEDTIEKYSNIKQKLYKMLPTSNFYIEDNIVFIENTIEAEKLQMPLNDFKIIFNYLLNIDSYNQLFSKSTTNKLHITTISDIIKLLLSDNITKENIGKLFIPLSLTYFINQNNLDIENIDTTKFNIENIKITDLYSLAAKTTNNQNLQTAKWKNISIPNDYLYEKIKEIIKKGTYYFNEDKFILENLDKNTNDFKINIEISNMFEFLKNNLNSILSKINQKAK